MNLVRSFDHRQVRHGVQVHLPCEGQLTNLEEFDPFRFPANFVLRLRHRSDGQLQPAEIGDVADEEVVVDDEDVQNVVDVLKLEAPARHEFQLSVVFRERRDLSRLPIFRQAEHDDVEEVLAAVEVPDDTRTTLEVVGREVVEHAVVL